MESHWIDFWNGLSTGFTVYNLKILPLQTFFQYATHPLDKPT